MCEGCGTVDHNLEQLKLLFDYTKFHIGLYSSIAGVLVAALATKHAEGWKVSRLFVSLAVLAIVVAGLAGGVVAASLPSMTNVRNFWDQPIGPYWSKCLTVRQWTYVEHSAFWAAVLFVLVAFSPVALAGAFKPASAPPPPPPPPPSPPAADAAVTTRDDAS